MGVAGGGRGGAAAKAVTRGRTALPRRGGGVHARAPLQAPDAPLSASVSCRCPWATGHRRRLLHEIRHPAGRLTGHGCHAAPRAPSLRKAGCHAAPRAPSPRKAGCHAAPRAPSPRQAGHLVTVDRFTAPRATPPSGLVAW